MPEKNILLDSGWEDDGLLFNLPNLPWFLNPPRIVWNLVQGHSKEPRFTWSDFAGDPQKLPRSYSQVYVGKGWGYEVIVFPICIEFPKYYLALFRLISIDFAFDETANFECSLHILRVRTDIQKDLQKLSRFLHVNYLEFIKLSHFISGSGGLVNGHFSFGVDLDHSFVLDVEDGAESLEYDPELEVKADGDAHEENQQSEGDHQLHGGEYFGSA